RTRLTAMRMLLVSDRERALGMVLDMAGRASDEEARRLLPLLAEMLQEEDDEVVRRVLEWLEDQHVVPAPSLVEELGSHGLVPPQTVAGLLTSPDPDARGAAAVALWHSWDPSHGLRAMEIMNDLLRADQQRILVAIRAIGRMGQERFAQVLVPYLSAPSPGVRLEALSAIRRLVTEDSSRLVPHIVQGIEAGTSAERAIGMDVLSRIGDSRCIIRLLLMCEAFTHFERRRAAQVVLSMGQRSVPAVVSVFSNAEYPSQARATAARCLGVLLFPEFEALYPGVIRSELQRAYQYLHFHVVLEQARHGSAEAAPVESPGIRVLSSFYRDYQWRIIEFVLEVLAIGGRLPDYEMIGSALNSPNQKARGNAIETIEQACTRETFSLLLPLVDSRGLDDRVRFYRKHLPFRDHSCQGIVDAAFCSRFPLECAAAAQAMYDAAGTGAFVAFRERLQQEPIPLLRETIVALLARHAGPSAAAAPVSGAPEAHRTHLNVVERIACLSRMPFFGHFGPLELLALARHALRRSFGAGERIYGRGEAAGTVYALLEGAVHLEQDGRLAERRPCTVFGEDCLFGRPTRGEDAVAQSATVLAVPREQVIRDASRQPRLALELLRAKVTTELGGRAQPQWN
ncbi:MAG: cyclic nucleotide-binding domain-containing protein, partial [Candidatus Latescibacterota bacterium]